MYYSGIDQHKRDSYIATYDAEGHLVKQQRVRNTPEQLRRYFAAFAGPHTAVVESTGSWYWLADVFAELDVELHLAHASRLKAISTAKVKTDRIDAQVLAALLRAGFIPDAHMIAPAQRAPRDLLRTRLRLVERRTQARNSIHRIFEKFNVRHSSELEVPYQLQVACHQDQLEVLGHQIATLERSVQAHLLPTADVQRLLWIPGIGPINALTIYTEIDGVGRFPSVRQFASYCRLVPGAYNSGGRQRHRSGAKAGNRYLKLAFSHAAVRAVQYYPVIRRFYQRTARRKGRPIARTLVALELARSVYHVLHTGEPFHQQFKGQPLRRRKRPQWPRLASPHLPSDTERRSPVSLP